MGSGVIFRGHSAAIAGLSLALATMPADAHHSIAGVYDSTQQVTIDGTVAELRFVNPHAFVLVNVTAGDGHTETWKLEMDNRYELVDAGMKADTIKPGDHVVAKGSRARDGSHAAYLLRLDRPADGFWYEQVGSSPHIGRSR